jgi:predicted RNA-binding protein with PIN domain
VAPLGGLTSGSSAMPYLIDGNNVLGSWRGRGPGRGREDVVRRVAAFCRARGARAILVFDGRPLRDDRPEQVLGGLRLLFPREGEEADDVIRRLVDAAPRPADLIVVTSDKALYSYTRTRGARVLRAHEWNALERQPGGDRPRRDRGADREKPEREDDVAGWLRAFGVPEE